MPDIAIFHPQLVHFAVVLGIVGVLFRLVSLTGKASWTNQAAAALLISAGVVGYVTAESGHQAHGPVERIPGAVTAVQEHEEWGNRARNILLIVGALELVGIFLRRQKAARIVRIASGVVGIGAVFALFEAAEHGGDLVYRYAGGPGECKDDISSGRLCLREQAGAVLSGNQPEREFDQVHKAVVVEVKVVRRIPGIRRTASGHPWERSESSRV